MERSSKLADLKLVSKYYPVAPVANYSYPQPERYSQYGRRHDRFSNERSSLGSEGSAPGLIDDRTDSEVSIDDDYQYHAHASELWDTFWLPSPTIERKEIDKDEPSSRKKYPALIPSPQRERRAAQEERRSQIAWPLPESPPRPRCRRSTATYSPFPKPISLPPRTTSLVPSWQCSRPMDRPRRPPRPDEAHLVSGVSQLSPAMAQFPTSPDTRKTSFTRPVTPPMKDPWPDHRPASSLDIQPDISRGSKNRLSSVASRSAVHLPLPESQPAPVILPKKSMPALKPAQLQLQPEPRSFFEYDDSESESESPSRLFFRFHKRSESNDARRSRRSSESTSWKRRTRASTAPSSPLRDQAPELPIRKRQTDVLTRMLGRRSR